MKKVMKKKGLITAMMLLLVIIAAFAVRIFYVENRMDRIHMDEQLMKLVAFDENGVMASDIFAGGFSARALYVLCMSLSCMVFGNFAVAGVYLNVGLQVLAVLILFGAGKNCYNRLLGTVFAATFAIAPMIIRQVSKVDEINMELLLAVAGFWCFSVIVYLFRYLHRKKNEKASLEKEKTMEMTKEEAIVQTQALAVPDSSMKEIILDDVEAEKPKFIENPLPVPKRRAHREMDFAIETDENDDYDITDMTGKDFFDIE